jgi:hypothetical protein
MNQPPDQIIVVGDEAYANSTLFLSKFNTNEEVEHHGQRCVVVEYWNSKHSWKFALQPTVRVNQG